MRRIDGLAIAFTLASALAALFLQHQPLVYDPDTGRRPIPVPPAPVPGIAAPPQAAGPIEGRVRRPLPGPSPDDPLFAVNVPEIPAHAVAIGTSFPIGSGLWLTARHVANGGCRQVLIMLGTSAVPTQIKYLDPEADLALLQTAPSAIPALPIASGEVGAGDTGYSFGFPHGVLGGFEGSLLGRSRMQFGGRLAGTTPVLAWAETRRFPDTLESLSGISGGPMLDESGNVVGIMVAASDRRGRTYSVAPEILRATRQEFGLFAPQARQAPASEVTTEPVSLPAAAAALRQEERIVETVCVPL
jgi:serine protease Do